MDKQYPWYDSGWLNTYMSAKDFIRQNHPTKLDDFVHAFDVFRTDPAFSIKKLPRLFDEATLAELKQLISAVDIHRTPQHELREFGRFVVHDLPYANALQESITDMVGDLVGEPVESKYNFLSLYWEMGVCGVHMDAPFAKWTVDFCIDQSSSWPIHFSKIVPWPEEGVIPTEDWQDAIKSDPANRFESHEMLPGEALIFSGSSQWHYRNPIERSKAENFCNLLFFHFIPAGTSDLTSPMNWKEIFGVPDLAELEPPTKSPWYRFS